MLDQIAICICGFSSVWLSQDIKPARQKYACVFGMIAQPFWYYATYKAHQWGIFLVCFLYTIAWAKGIYNYWLSPPL